jgi:hypothetical protein
MSHYQASCWVDMVGEVGLPYPQTRYSSAGLAANELACDQGSERGSQYIAGNVWVMNTFSNSVTDR